MCRSIAVLALLLSSSCGTIKQVERTAAAWERTAEALRVDATSRSKTTDSLGSLIEQATPYLLAILLALAWAARALFVRGAKSALNGSATPHSPSGSPPS